MSTYWTELLPSTCGHLTSVWPCALPTATPSKDTYRLALPPSVNRSESIEATPLDFASLSILAADAESRLTIRSTFTPWLIMFCASVVIWSAELFAFCMMQFRLTFWHSALAASGSDVIHRFEDCVSGQMMPTLAPLPSIAPAAAELLVAAGLDADVLPAAGVVVLLLLFLLEEQALSTSEAATPATTRPIALLRMGCTAFRGTWDRVVWPPH